MKAKEKAKELVMRFQYLVNGWDCYHDEPVELTYKLSDMKQCALISVDEMLEFAYDIEWEKKEEAISKLKFLKEVKQEVNKL